MIKKTWLAPEDTVFARSISLLAVYNESLYFLIVQKKQPASDDCLLGKNYSHQPHFFIRGQGLSNFFSQRIANSSKPYTLENEVWT